MSEKTTGLEELLEVRRRAKAEGRKLVFTNGVFDLLHRGHVEYLQKARALGDLLVVGLNSDASVHAIKGPKRPLVPQGDRAAVLAALECVGHIVLFEEETPGRLIEALLPDVLVKGADYTVEQIAGADAVRRSGGRVVTIELTPGRSTSGLIKRIVSAYGQE